jgi:hypothetical protein
MSTQFNWEVISRDDETNTLVVKYSKNEPGFESVLSIPKPVLGSDIEKHIAGFMPASFRQPANQEFADVVVGSTGTVTIPSTSAEAVVATGQMFESNMRALIHTVIAEIDAGTV